MDELTQGSSQGQVVAAPAQAVVQANSSPVTASVPSQESGTASGRSFTQAELNRIVGDAKKDAVDRFRRLQVEQPEYFSQKYSDSNAQGVQANPISGQAQGNQQANQVPLNVSIDDIRRTAAEEVQRSMDATRADEQRKAQQQVNERIVADFFTKLNTEKESYPDLDNKMSNLDLSKMANTVWLAQGLDHKAVKSLFTHFGDNPYKAMQMEQLSYHNPKGAQVELNKLVESLRLNEEASNLKLANSPLRQSKPGNSGLGSGEGLTIAQAKAKYKG